jgi:hypothetical protein
LFRVVPLMESRPINFSRTTRVLQNNEKRHSSRDLFLAPVP